MLASSGRLVMRQLFRGRGNDEEVHKGMTGNTMLIAQPAPQYEQVLPNSEGLSQGLVTLFCKSVEDVSKAQMLVVNREQFRTLAEHRKRVCPVFAETAGLAEEIDKLPDNAVPQCVLQGAQAVPEAAAVKTTLHGPGNRIPMFARPEQRDSESEHESDGESIGETPPDAAPVDAGDHLGAEELNICMFLWRCSTPVCVPSGR